MIRSLFATLHPGLPIDKEMEHSP